jgi:hypothetical protein
MFAFRLRALPKSERRSWEKCGSFVSVAGSALLIVLCLVVLLTIVVTAFLAQSNLSRQIFSARAGQTEVDVLADSAIEFMKADFRQEIISGSTNNPSVYSANNSTGVAVPLFIPSTNQTVVPSRTGFTPGATVTADPYANIVKISKNGTYFFPQASPYNIAAYPPTSYASASSTGDPSLNGRYIDNAANGWTTNGWDKPQLIDTTANPTALQAGQIPLPDWIYVTTSGRKTPAITAPESDVVGRYAYVVYDEGGLLDINSAGCDATKMSPADAYDVARKGSLGLADLTQIPGITTAIQQALVGWRNHTTSSSSYTPPALAYPPNAPGYLQYLVDGSLNNGFLKTIPGDQKFLSRQDLLAYAPTLGIPTQSLAYLGTFTRTINAPTWTPIDPPGAFFTSTTALTPVVPTSYAANAENVTYATGGATSVSVSNRDIINVRWPNDVKFVRPVLSDDSGNTGSSVLTETVTFKQGDPVVQHRFPLSKIALLSNPSAQTGSPSTVGSVAWAVQYYFGLQWVTTDANLPEPHWQYVNATSAEGDTGATDGSPSPGGAKYTRTVHQVAALGTREPDFFEMINAGKLRGSGTNPVGGNIYDIGINIIDQFDSDDLPTVLTLNSAGQPRLWFGKENLPYLYQLLFWPYRITSDATRQTFEAYLVPELWNPHRNASTASTAFTNLRILVYDTTAATRSGSTWVNADGGDIFATLYAGTSVASTVNYYETDGFNPTAIPSPGYVTPDLSLHAALTAADGTKPALTINSPSSYTFQEPTILTPTMATLSNNPRYSLSAVDKEHPNRTGFYLGYAPKAPDKLVGKALGLPAGTYNTYSQFSQANVTTHAPTAQSDGAWFRLQYSTDNAATWHTYEEAQVGFGNPTFWNTTDTAGANGVDASPCFSGLNPGASAASYFGLVSAGMLDPRMDSLYLPGRCIPISLTLSFWNAVISGSPSGTGVQPTWRPNKNTTSGATTFYALNNSAGFPSSVAKGTNAGLYSENNGSTTYQDMVVISASGGTTPDFVGDFVDRPADGANGAYPMATSNIADRPIILNRPFLSVGELGYAFGSVEWKTLNFSSPVTGDAGLLDLFSINDTENVDQQSMISGVLNINTHNPAVLQAMISGGLIDVGDPTGGTAITTTDAQTMANAIVTETTLSNKPLLNRAELATRVASLSSITSALASDGYVTKDRREAVVRALAEPADTRTWNLLIDLVVQAGRYPPTAISAGNAAALAQFDVQGERRYWLHLAIDRYTGKVIDEQLEAVHDN